MRTVLAICLLITLDTQAQIIQTNWSVDSPFNCTYPHYNNETCLINSHAIAMAQVINYYNHPEYPFQSNCYQSNVGNLCSEGLTIYFDDTLLFSSTVLEMDIACQSSYSPYPLAWNCGLVNVDTVRNVLRDFYGYQCETDSVNHVLPELRDNIALEQPFIIETYPYSGGCSRFVLIDDYDWTTDRWHCNWGWGWFHNIEWWHIDSMYFCGQIYGKTQTCVYNIVPDSITVTGYLIYDGTQDTISGYILYGNDTVFSGETYTTTKQTLYPDAITDATWGNSNAVDAMLILKHFTGMQLLTGLRKEAADVTNDMLINSVDALYVAKRFVGQLLTFPSPDYIFEYKELTMSGNYTIFGRCNGDVSP